MKILVAGCGSIGARHIGNLKSLGISDIIGCESDRKMLDLIQKKYGIPVFTDLNAALKQCPDAVFICTPPHLHIKVALETVKTGAHLFIEKPISHNLKNIDKLIRIAKARRLVIMVGYNWRFYRGLETVKTLLSKGKIGRIISIRIEAGQYLPDWRPQQDYRKSYTAKKSMGGGIILDGSHEIDYARWLFGDVKEVFCLAGKLSNLKVDTEDTAEITLKFRNNIIANVHLDFVQRVYSRSCKIIGEKGTILWDYPTKTIKIYTPKENNPKPIKTKPNDMYLNEVRHFINCIKSDKKPLVDGIEGKKTLEVALSAKKSARTGKIVSL